jgi:hypothetical protein
MRSFPSLTHLTIDFGGGGAGLEEVLPRSVTRRWYAVLGDELVDRPDMGLVGYCGGSHPGLDEVVVHPAYQGELGLEGDEDDVEEEWEYASPHEISDVAIGLEFVVGRCRALRDRVRAKKLTELKVSSFVYAEKKVVEYCEQKTRKGGRQETRWSEQYLGTMTVDVLRHTLKLEDVVRRPGAEHGRWSVEVEQKTWDCPRLTGEASA